MASTKDRFPCTGIEACRLRYLKFACVNEPATIEFYQTLGMTLDGRSTFGRNHYVFRMSYRTSSPEFNENSLQLHFEVIKPPIDPNAASGAGDTHASTPAAGSPSSLAVVASPASSSSGGAVDAVDAASALAGPVLFDRTCPRDYLIVYMHFLPRVIKRLHAKGFRALLGMQTVMDNIHYAIYLDPNGVEVRLMELPDVHLNEVASWFARIGYYVAQVPHADEFRHYLESLFSKQRRTTAMLRALQQAPAADASALASVAASGAPSTATTTSNYLKANIATALGAGGPGGPGASGATAKRANAADRFYQRDGIRLVDAEDIATGLQQTKYLWFGQLNRDKMGTLCISERTGAGEGDDPKAVTVVTANPAVRRNHRLVAIGIEVGCTVDQAVSQIVREAPECLIVQDERWKVQDVGYIARARGMYAFIFELVSTQDPFPGEPAFIRLNMQQHLLQPNGAGGKRGFGAGSSLGIMRTGTANSSGSGRAADPYINFNQPLRATLSESALCRPAVWTGGGPEGVLRPVMVNGVDVASAGGGGDGTSLGGSVAGSRPGTRGGVSGMKRRKSM
ncbi:hypothetical protein BCR44DRAFT_145432, partial [Catenaria anguillulae PL171]